MQKPKLLWLNCIIFALSAIITLGVVPYYAYTVGFDGWQIAALILGVVICEISITAGYHRLWSHKAYKASSLVKMGFMLGATFATQNSILHWASDHRQHHRHVDDESDDPYSARRGFWYSHIGWMLREYDADKDFQYDNVPDLKEDPIVMWQHRHYLPLVLGLNFGIPIALGLLHGDLLGMVLLLGVARLFISHHFTFLINSLAHIWGSQPYSDDNSSKDNGLLAVLTMGEGYHNFHHAFQRDYRNGIRWWHFDPTKWLISILASVGLAYKLYRAPVEKIESSRARMLMVKTSKRLDGLPHAEDLKLRLQSEYDSLVKKVNQFAHAKKLWLEANKTSIMAHYDIEALKARAEQLKTSFQQQKKQWLMLNAQIA